MDNMLCGKRIQSVIMTVPIACALLFGLMLSTCSSNQMDPHIYPNRGPFFEGWYLRIIDSEKNSSFAFLFGHVLPAGTHSNCWKNWSDRPCLSFTNSSPVVFLGQLISLETGSKLDSPTGFFYPSQYNVTQNGRPVVHNPDDKTPPHFEVKIANNLSYSVYPNSTRFLVTVGDHILEGETTSPVPWGPNGEGPEGVLEKLPVAVHWFVYSLRSVVKYYKYRNLRTGQVVSGSSGQGIPIVAHMEKDWGKGFPKAWVWAEGVDPKTNVSFALSAGLLTELDLDIKVQLSGYRNPGKGISCSFKPINSLHTLYHDGCVGKILLQVESLTCRVTFEVSAPLNTFSSCLQTPGIGGFSKGCIESYSAVANITVQMWQKDSMALVDNQIIHMAALEFGQKYMCNSSCPVEKATH